MAPSDWQSKIDKLIELGGPQHFLEFRKGENMGNESGIAAELLHLSLSIGLAEMVFERAMTLPDSDLSSLPADLDRLWQAALDERDTSMLTESDAAEDDLLVEQLEMLRREADSMIAILEAYAADDAPLNEDINALIRQVMFLSETNLHDARKIFGRAGAAVLRGARVWPLWRTEAASPQVRRWLAGLNTLREMRRDRGEFPLPPIAEQRRRFAARAAAQPKPDEPELSPEQKKLMEILLCGEEELTPDQIAAVPLSDPKIVEQLIDVLDNLEYQMEDSEGKGFAPIHAAKLLGLSHSPQAVYPLIETLYAADFDEIILSTATFALKELGPLALPAVLESMEYSSDDDFKLSLADVLGSIGRGDERAFRAAEAYFHNTTWEDDREFAAGTLAELADPRAVPILRTALADRDITPGGVHEISFALSELDPDHDPREIKQLAAKAIRRYESRTLRFDKHGRAFCRDCGAPMRKLPNGEWIHVKPEPATPRAPALPASPIYTGVGRNDPCPCGSGRKFKHCHGSGKMTVN